MNLFMEDTAVAMALSTETNHNSLADKETLYMLSGVALMVFGAGLLLTSPVVRRYMGQIGLGNLAADALPDLDRYLRLRQM